MTPFKPKPLQLLVGVVVLLTLVELVNLITGRSLVTFGILPRTVSGLQGILFAPFIHGSFTHFLSNLLPLCVLMYLLSLGGINRLLWVSVLAMLLTGFSVWLLGGQGYHVGASGLVYSYFGFLVVNGFASKNIKQLLIAIVTIVFYGGLIFGVFPGKTGISWESHLLGMLVGGVLGYRLK